jgi:glycosyltransferase involved in cell wall biosynthesis
MVRKMNISRDIPTRSDSMHPRVLILTSYDFNGRYFRDLASIFSKQKREFAIMSIADLGHLKWDGTSEITDLTIRNLNFGVARIFFQFRAVKAFRPDIIQTHLFRAGVVGILFGKLLGIKVILTRHHIDEHAQVGTFLHQMLDRLCAKLANHVVVFSNAAKRWLIECEKIDPGKISVINQGFDFSRLEPGLLEIKSAKNELGYRSEHFNVLCIARYSKTKGQEYLVQAMSMMVKEYSNVRLAFIGPGDPTWLITYIKQSGLDKYIKCLPSRNDVQACIAASDLVVHPSLADSFSQLIIEVQAVGCALIATDIAAAREQIEEESTGLIVAPRDPAAIYKALRRLYLDPSLRDILANEGKKHVRRKFSIERMYREQVQCYQNVFAIR